MRKILLLSYFFDPFKGVGAKRMSYWAHSFFGDVNADYECTVITATPQPEPRASVIYVEDKKSLLINRLFEGISWVPDLKAFFSSTPVTYDFVVISGGPFGHFWITRYLKRKFKCKIILDFRDPFSRNSRFKTFFLKDYVKVLFEKAFLKHADHVITVNDYCKALISKNILNEKVTVIENGYDERVIDLIPAVKFNDGLVHVVYAGSFYEDRDPTIFLKQLLAFNQHTQKYVLHHVGSFSEYLKPFKGTKSIEEHGEKNYQQTLEIMKKCTLGLIITGGEPMESTTKIYDYIGCDLDILVITNGAIKTGSINAITSRVEEKVFWLKNNEGEVRQFFEKYKDENRSISNKSCFSRHQGHNMLKEVLSKI